MACGSLLSYAPQHVLDRVGEGCEAHYDKQVRQGAAQESVVPVGLLQAREVGPCPRRVRVEALEPVLAVVRGPIWNHVRERESRGSAAEFILCFLLLFNFLREQQQETRVGLNKPGSILRSTMRPCEVAVADTRPRRFADVGAQ